MPPPLNSTQRKVARRIFRTGRKVKASPREQLAALETGLTEANLTNPAGGHGTSAGWRQEIDTYGPVSKRRNVEGAAKRFFSETKAAGPQKYGTAGQLAQAVQRSAFPERYDEREGEARRILEWLRKTEGSGATPRARRYERRRTVTETTPGIDRSADRTLLLQQYLAGGRRTDQLVPLAQALSETTDVPATETTKTVVRGAQKPVRRVSGSGSGTTNMKQLTKLAKDMGLHVSEDRAHDPVDPVHTSGSYHYQDVKGLPRYAAAADISGPPELMAKFARLVAKRYGRDLEELIYRGPGSSDAVNIKHGKRVGRGFYSAHEDHVHVADVERR